MKSKRAKQDAQGRYCLNDLHKASGGKLKDKPANFLRKDETGALIDEIGRVLTSEQAPVHLINDGFNNGTYVVKELVYAYAMWISAAFQLKGWPWLTQSKHPANPSVN